MMVNIDASGTDSPRLKSGKGPAADIGISCDFIFQGGSEAVVDVLADAFPAASLYVSVYDPASLVRYPSLERAAGEGRLHASLAQRLVTLAGVPRTLSYYHFYWLYFLTSTFQRTASHDAVIVSCCAQSKLIRVPEGTKLVVYFHTPTRWLYRQLYTSADLSSVAPPLRVLMSALNLLLRPLDRLGMVRLRAHDPVWLCNSSYVRDRIRQIYGVDCRVVFPPVDVGRFTGTRRGSGDFFLYHGRLAPQKRVDVAIKGCLLARKKLVISGRATTSEMQSYLASIVLEAEQHDATLKGLVTFRGGTTDAELRNLLSECKALIFPPREDFGITPIEAFAAGVPVIAYREGGALDYLKPGVNGLFFSEQTGDSLAEVLEGYDPSQFDPDIIARSFGDLSPERFQREISAIVDAALATPTGENPNQSAEGSAS
jgi:glycosyltransferase involved in cell wall biosynthesis